MVLPSRCLGTGSDPVSAGVEMLTAGRELWGWSSQGGLPGGNGARPGRVGTTEKVERKDRLVSNLM